MPTPRRPQNILRHPLFLAYFDLYCLHRGVLAMLVKRGIVPPERFEADVIRWADGERQKLLDEALERFQDFVLRVADVERDQPPEGQPGSDAPPRQ